MSKLLGHIGIILMLFFTSSLFGQSKNNLKLWYDKPAENWNEALPIGNGRLGAMVFGSPSVERLQLNEETIWAGQPNSIAHEKALEALPEVRKLIFEGKYKEAQDLATSDIRSQTNNGMPYQTFGNVYISFAGHSNYTDYYRDLDIQNAIASVSYKVDGVTFNREILSAFKDDVIAVKLSADRPGMITTNILMQSPYDKTDPVSRGDVIMLDGTSSNHEGLRGGVDFEGRLAVETVGGSVKSENGTIAIKDADSATIYISIATNFKNYKDLSEDVRKKTISLLNNARKKDFESIKKNHSDYYQKFFNRVSLILGKTEALDQPTNLRIKNFSEQYDPQLVELYFQFGRYLLISSSQPGGQPANLQGIWNDMLFPPWESKYTMNINAEMNYWPAELTNLSEMHEPFIQLAKEVSETGRETAKIMYDADGWVLHHNTDIWRITGPIDNSHSGMWPSGGAWLMQDLWERYNYSGNKKYLDEIYPILKGSAEFFLDFMVPHPEFGYLVVVPSNSPENSHGGGEGNASITAGATMDQQLMFDLFTHTAEAAKILNKDKDFVQQLNSAKQKLAPMQIGRYGQLQEWLKDWDDPEDDHRHISHLYGLFPSNQISPFRNPELFESTKVVLEHRGDKSTGWSMGWKVNLWARLLDGNHAYKLLNDQLSLVGDDGGGSYPNMLDAHPPFQIDGNFGVTAGIAEMLMQSHEGAVHLLPALPDAWNTGSIKGIRARGGFTIEELKWSNNKIQQVTIKSNLGGNLRLRTESKMDLKKLKLAKGENSNSFFKINPIQQPIIKDKSQTSQPELPKYYEYDIETEKGKTYTFSSK
ncbi:glycoside hydrolase family 95 protein [Zunongwangia endophytica]|uniref:Glycoside hydrolase family 95 protein n=1 Tax=Zunongwangia endophytica TaxID=1808945 RepID=A0ABV8HA47_9FLAO|nr:glycoside hydrolase family 95 protein [Zunongwangia endophytica]MDN3594821.1 glycoside hydrolase family 95 protein [Zunongwangia endophytica]